MRAKINWTPELLLNNTKASGECLLWTRCLNSEGYGRLSINGDVNIKAHRLMYSLCNPNEDISTLVIRHTCDTPSCINPSHLISGTAADNVKDKMDRRRHSPCALTETQVKEIRAIYSTGQYLQKDLAHRYNVNHRTISYIINNKTYRWVPAQED